MRLDGDSYKLIAEREITPMMFTILKHADDQPRDAEYFYQAVKGTLSDSEAFERDMTSKCLYALTYYGLLDCSFNGRRLYKRGTEARV